MAEGREPLAPEDQVDQMLNEVLGREYPPLRYHPTSPW
jgi:hypothetical protein